MLFQKRTIRESWQGPLTSLQPCGWKPCCLWGKCRLYQDGDTCLFGISFLDQKTVLIEFSHHSESEQGSGQDEKSTPFNYSFLLHFVVCVCFLFQVNLWGFNLKHFFFSPGGRVNGRRETFRLWMYSWKVETCAIIWIYFILLTVPQRSLILCQAWF